MLFAVCLRNSEEIRAARNQCSPIVHVMRGGVGLRGLARDAGAKQPGCARAYHHHVELLGQISL